MNYKLISVDFLGQFGFLRKPDINDKDSVRLTYNFLHKPALLGILGAIVGIGGYAQAHDLGKGRLPAYYNKLKHLKTGIQPLWSEKGNFQKTVVQYNNSVGYANKDGGILQLSEQTIIKPTYRIYLLLDQDDEIERELYVSLREQSAIYIPYFGKNEFQLWWKEYKEYEYDEDYTPKASYQVATLFRKNSEVTVRESIDHQEAKTFDASASFAEESFVYFENLPFGFDSQAGNYQMEKFVFTNIKLKSDYRLDNLYFLNSELIVQLT